MTPPRGWLALAAAALAGATAAFGQAPYDMPILMFIALALGVWLANGSQTPRQAALLGWAFAFGYFGHALHWIVSPFMVDVARHGWMAPFALVFLAAGLALFWGAAFWVARWLSSGPVLWPLILTLPAVEMLRAYIFTGFPWAMPAQVLVGVLGGQSLALIGPYVLNLLIVGLCVTFSWLGGGRKERLWLLLLPQVVVVLCVAILVMPMRTGTPAALSDHTIRLVQPNAPQNEKWDPEKIPVFFDRQLQFTAAPPEQGAPDLVLWSETAIPWRLDHAGTILDDIARAGGQATVALGVQRADDAGYYNSMVVLGPEGGVEQVYDKHHLVPFGEYIPLARLFNRIGVFGLAQRVPEGYSPGPGPKLLDFGPLGRALPLICYEAVFAHDVNAAPARPDFLIQITNDAWFGNGAGPRQHLAQARMRAIEQGLPLARAANTGISAMIDPHGRVLAALALNEAGFIDAALPLPLPPTPYSRTGDLPLALFLLAALGLAVPGKRRV